MGHSIRSTYDRFNSKKPKKPHCSIALKGCKGRGLYRVILIKGESHPVLYYGNCTAGSQIVEYGSKISDTEVKLLRSAGFEVEFMQ